MMSNWHIEIADCNEAQKEVLKRVYGNLPININTYLGLYNGIVIGTFGPDSMGELITPDEAFERLGLNHYAVNQKLSKQIVEAEQKIKELEQQLAAKPLSKINWSIIDPAIIFITQHRRSGEIYFHGRDEFDSDDWQIIATRPKPKYTPEQIEAAKAYDEWLDLNSGLLDADECFEHWLKEVGND